LKSDSVLIFYRKLKLEFGCALNVCVNFQIRVELAVKAYSLRMGYYKSVYLMLLY